MATVKWLFLDLLLLFLLFHDAVADQSESNVEKITESKSLVHIGAIFDPDTLDGAIAEISMSLAVADFYALHPNYQTRLSVHFTTAKDLVTTAAAAVDLLKKFKVHAIIGPQIPAAAPFLVELGEKAQVPIISFFETSPALSPTEYPFFIRVTQNDSLHVKAISAVLQNFSWHEVVLMFEDADYGAGFISFLVDELQENDIRISHMSKIPTSAEDFQISKELSKLSTMQTRVFIVHMNTALASRLFALVDKKGMMSKGYTWIVTARLSNSLNVLDSEVIDSMEGVLGVRSHLPKSKELGLFDRRWKSKLHSMKPNSSVTEINISGLWAFDTIFALAKAIEKILSPTNPSIVNPNNPSESTTDFGSLGISRIGPILYNQILNTQLKGLSGEFHLVNGQLGSSVFEVVNVIGTGRVVGYWTSEKGLTQTLDSTSKNDLKRIIWPGDSIIAPTGWAIPNLVVGTPVKLGFPEFLRVHKDDYLNKNIYSGFCIDIFNAALEIVEGKLGMKIHPQFVPYEDANGEMAGTYDDLLLQIKLKKFDAVVGDISIVANRTDYVEFTLPYSESGVTMLVPVKRDNRHNMWIFLKPWTWDLWLTVFVACIFIALIIRTMERQTENSEFGGSPRRQLGMIFMFPFYAMVIPQRELVVRDCSKFVLVIWLWLAFILMQSYTASLSSILTVDQLEPTFADLKKLRTESHFAFARGSPLISHFSQAILLVRENQTRMDQMEKKYFGENVMTPTLARSISSESSSLRAYNFSGLFIIVGIAALLALLISERYIWQKPVSLVNKYLTSQENPSNEAELVSQPTILQETDIAAGHSLSPGQAEDSGNSERTNSGHISGDTSAEEYETENVEAHHP
ncbi:glutamate receptor [Citrus sinensis]|uniref:Glutamate receptor n=1 Tax=Citrus sinensis TaxID=2711 RepID=A0ACB8P8R3_CITSI|nr:glutamate receptor [Citrus sinensis]